MVPKPARCSIKYYLLAAEIGREDEKIIFRLNACGQLEAGARGSGVRGQEFGRGV